MRHTCGAASVRMFSTTLPPFHADTIIAWIASKTTGIPEALVNARFARGPSNLDQT